MKKYQKFLSENLHFLVVKFSVHLNRRVFVMSNPAYPRIRIRIVFVRRNSQQYPTVLKVHLKRRVFVMSNLAYPRIRIRIVFVRRNSQHYPTVLKVEIINQTVSIYRVLIHFQGRQLCQNLVLLPSEKESTLKGGKVAPLFGILFPSEKESTLNGGNGVAPLCGILFPFRINPYPEGV